jgi:hypothetical protein
MFDCGCAQDHTYPSVLQPSHGSMTTPQPYLSLWGFKDPLVTTEEWREEGRRERESRGGREGEGGRVGERGHDHTHLPCTPAEFQGTKSPTRVQPPTCHDQSEQGRHLGSPSMPESALPRDTAHLVGETFDSYMANKKVTVEQWYLRGVGRYLGGGQGQT